MFRALSLLLVGGLFGIGLAISGMLNPAKVAGFLDLFGVWDPSLAFVMGAAWLPISLATALSCVARRRSLAQASPFRPTAELTAGCCQGPRCWNGMGAWGPVSRTGCGFAWRGAGRCRPVRCDDAGGSGGWPDADQRPGASSGAAELGRLYRAATTRQSRRDDHRATCRHRYGRLLA